MLGALGSVLLLGCALLPSPAALPEDFVFYPPAPETPRLQHLVTYSTDADVVGAPSAFQRLVLGEREKRELGKPYGIAFHGGQIFVCDTKRNLVLIFDLLRKTIDAMGTGPNGQLRKPISIAIAPDGTRYVADTRLRRVMVYDSQNRYVGHLGDPDAWIPSGLLLHESRLYVADRENGNVVVVDPRSGEELSRFGRFFFPTNLAMDAEGDLYVTDTGNARVQKFDLDGALLQEFGSLGQLRGQFVRPKGLAVDRSGRLYVVDAAFENVQIFDPEGRLLLGFGTAGNIPGGLNIPAGLAIDYDHVDLFRRFVAPGYDLEYLVLVTSQFGANKINVYGFLRDGQVQTRPEPAPNASD